MLLSLLVTTRCPAHCKHCCYSSGPHGSDIGDYTMTITDAFYYVDQACTLPDRFDSLGISGGEPFLLSENLIPLIDYARSKGACRTICNTSAYWATSREATIRRLEPLSKAGLTDLSISTDMFHQEFVPIERIIHATWAARQLGINVQINYQTTRSHPNWLEVMEKLGKLAEEVVISENPCLPLGAAKRNVPTEDLQLTQGFPAGPCPLPTPVIHANGDLYFCCSPGGWTPILKIGNAKEYPLLTLWNRYRKGELFRILITEGPSAFLPGVVKSGLVSYLPSAYVDICHFCHEILTNPKLLDCIQAEIHANEIARVRKLFV